MSNGKVFPKCANKYGAKRATVNNITFDSRREAKRYGELKMLQRGKEIRGLQLQVPIVLEGRDGPLLTENGRHARYIADFTYIDNRSELYVIEDVKGMKTDVYKLKRSILNAMGIEIKEV